MAGTALRPECVARAGGIDCFIVDTSRNLKVVRRSNGKWSTFKKLAGSVGIPPHCLVSGNRMDCFAQSSSGGLLKAGYNGSSWSSSANAGGRVGSQPDCSRVTDGVDCFWTTPDFKLVQRQLRGGSWRPEADLGGPAQQRPICLSQDGGGRIDCLVRGTDNSLRQRTNDRPLVGALRPGAPFPRLPSLSSDHARARQPGPEPLQDIDRFANGVTLAGAFTIGQ